MDPRPSRQHPVAEKGVKKYMLEEERKCDLGGKPKRVSRTDWNPNDRNVGSRSSLIVDQAARDIIEAPEYRDESR